MATQNLYKEEVKRNLPYAAFGVGSGVGMLANRAKRIPGAATARKAPGLRRVVSSLGRARKSGMAAALMPIVGGTAAYSAGIKATGRKMDTPTAAALYSLGGGASAVGIYDKMLKGRAINPLKRNVVGSLGAIGGGLLATKIYGARKRRQA